MRLGVIALSLGIAGTGFATAPKESAKSSKSKHSWFQIGKASWYGAAFNGHRTATGEKFDANALTCAHRTLPLGSWVRVTNLVNRKAAFLRVNDRGPVPQSRILDLSYAAARKLGIGGIGRVSIEPIREGDMHMAGNDLPELFAGTEAARQSYMQVASNADGVPLLPPSVAQR